MTALLLAAAVLSAAPQPPTARLESRLSELERRWKDENEKVLAASHALLSAQPEARAEALPALEAYRETAKTLILEMTILARRLEEYKRTGILPESVADADDIERFLADPWTGMPPDADPHTKITRVKELPLDYRKLIEALERYGGPRRVKETLKTPIARASEPKPRLPAPFLVPDAGRGRAKTDPVPELIRMLGAEAGRERALAADMLGGLGRDARPAIPRLVAALGDGDGRVRASAADALGRVGELDERSLEALRGLLEDPDLEVRRSAKAALAERKP